MLELETSPIEFEELEDKCLIEIVLAQMAKVREQAVPWDDAERVLHHVRKSQAAAGAEILATGEAGVGASVGATAKVVAMVRGVVIDGVSVVGFRASLRRAPSQ